MEDWTTAAPAVLAAFLASLVEVVEAFTIVLAVGVTRGWRPALAGAAAALAVLALAVLLLGPLLEQAPLQAMQFVIGVLLLLFGMSWLRKAALRAGGALPLHDEEAAFAAETQALAGAGPRARRMDWIGGMTAFKAVLLEGLEVAFIVVAVGAGRGLTGAAALGALAACALVLAVGALVHRPLARVPENTLKFGVGVMLTAFGVFWTGEGLGVEWPGHDLALLALGLLCLGAGLVGVRMTRATRAGAQA